MKRFDAIWKSTSGALTDITSNTLTNTSFNFISAATETFYFGLLSRFTGIYVDLETNGSYTSLTYQYLSDSGWKTLALIDSYQFTTSKYLRWVLPDDAIYMSVNSGNTTGTTGHPDTILRYWMRISCSAVTTMAVISKIRAIPNAMYTTPRDVAKYMQLTKEFDNESKPSIPTVEKLIVNAESRIDYKTRKSWKFNSISEEYEPILVDYNRYGFFLRHRNFTKVYSVQLWNGGQWQTLVEGRNNDYFVNNDLGMIYLTRLFLLPAAYGMTGRYYHWGFGEFKNSVKVDYVYGRNWETDKEFGMVQQIANMITAKNLWLNHDYSNFIASGSDKVPLDSKIMKLDQDIESNLDELTGIALY